MSSPAHGKRNESKATDEAVESREVVIDRLYVVKGRFRRMDRQEGLEEWQGDRENDDCCEQSKQTEDRSQEEQRKSKKQLLPTVESSMVQGCLDQIDVYEGFSSESFTRNRSLELKNKTQKRRTFDPVPFHANNSSSGADGVPWLCMSRWSPMYIARKPE